MSLRSLRLAIVLCASGLMLFNGLRWALAGSSAQVPPAAEATQTALAQTQVAIVCPGDPACPPYPYPYPYPNPNPYPYPYPYPNPYPNPYPTAVPAAPSAEPREEREDRSELRVRQRLGAGAAQPGDVLSFTVVAANRGAGRALDKEIVFSYGGAPAELLDVALDRQGAWVRQIDPGRVLIRSGELPGGAELTLRLRLRLSPDAEPGAQLTTRVGADGRQGNSLVVRVGQAVGATGPLRLEARPAAGPAGAVFVAEAPAIFAPGEPVALWYTASGGATRELGRTRADEAGAAVARLDSAGLAPGAYSLVLRGVYSEVEAAAALTIAP